MQTILTIVIVLLVLGLLQRRFRGRGMTSSVLSDTGSGTPVRLVSASCTTGWHDWVHGELLLLPDGILRVRQNLQQTAEKGNAAAIEGEAIELPADPERLAAARADRRNLFVAAHRTSVS